MWIYDRFTAHWPWTRKRNQTLNMCARVLDFLKVENGWIDRRAAGDWTIHFNGGNGSGGDGGEGSETHSEITVITGIYIDSYGAIKIKTRKVKAVLISGESENETTLLTPESQSVVTDVQYADHALTKTISTVKVLSTSEGTSSNVFTATSHALEHSS